MDVVQFLPLINSGGVLALLLIVVVGGSRGWWYYGHVYATKAKECEDWKQLALAGVDTIKEAVAVMEPIVERLGR